MECILPDFLKGKGRYIYAVIFLEDEDGDERFNPVGKSEDEIKEAAGEGKILFGFAGKENTPELHTLTHGLAIKEFIFKGKAEGGPTSLMSFNLPATYQDGDKNTYPVPAGKTVKFYPLTEPGVAVINVDHVFTGTTGSSISCEIPPALIGAKRYFLAMVDLEGGFDLQGKTQQEIGEAVAEGKILFGKAINYPHDQNLKEYTLAHGVVVEHFDLLGKGDDDPVNLISFSLPATYQDGDKNTYPVPAGKTVKFYPLTEPGVAVINVDHVFTGTTGSSISCEIPPALIGAKRYFLAMVDLEGDFDLQGKTQQEIGEAVAKGKILFGKAINYPYDQNLKEYTLVHGVVVEHFDLLGKGDDDPANLISFNLPATYQDGDGNTYPIPTGETVKFYPVTDPEAAVFYADHVFTGITGSSIISCEIPSSLIGAERYFNAIVVLEGDYDLLGKTQAQIMAAVFDEGRILFGKALDYPPSKNQKLYTIANGVNVENFIFFGKSQ